MNDIRLSELRPQKSPVTDDGEFVDLGWRCVFAEHVDRDGVAYNSDSMRKIAARCNERIEETGDWSPICLGHTGPGLDPKVVGFAGPFKTGVIGKKNKKAAIFAKWRIFREDAHEVRRRPRCSVELWTSEKRKGEGFLDPISLLGATTPELDLGVHYAKDEKNGLRCVKYSRLMHYEAAPVAAGGQNTSVPALGTKKKTTYEASKTMLSAEDLQQIVAALTPVIQATVAEMNPAPQVSEEMPDMPGTEPDGDEDAIAPELPEGEGDASPDAPEDVPSPDVDDAPPTDEPKPEEAKPEEPPKKDDEDDSPAVKKYQRERDEYQVKYQKAVTELREVTEEKNALAAVVEGSKREARRAVRYQKLTELATAGYVITPEEEIADVENLDDSAFAKFTDTVVKKYQRIPVNMLPVPKGLDLASDSDKKQVQYQKEAREMCDTAIKAGKHIPYRDAVETVRKKYEAA